MSEEEKSVINKLESIKVNVEGKLYNFEASEILCLINNLQKENEKKDKQIDLMAEFINKQDIDEDICKNNMSDLCDEFGTGINCIKCIKQYFEKLAKEKKIKYEREKR